MGSELRLKIAAAVMFMATLVAGPAFAADIESARIWRAPDNTRLVLDISDAFDYSVFPLDNPSRLVVDIKGAQLKANLDSLDISPTPISKIRSAVRDGSDLRIVLELKTKVRVNSFTLKANEQYGDRLVVDLFDDVQVAKKPAKKVLPKTNRKIVISIDAGHGGDDPGAIGPKRIYEKVIVFQIAQRLEKLFDQNPDFSGELVRTGDYYLKHRKRTTIARNSRADFFLSIHADAFTNPKANGASVYALSTRGSSSEAARYLAKKENRADLIGGAEGSLNLDDKDAVLAGVLLDLSMTATLSSSLKAGKYVLKNMGGVARLHKKRVEQAGFLVLKSPDIPSLLIETGFISNPKEAKQLSSGAYQQRMAAAIYNGLVSYYMDNTPKGTSLAANKAKRERSYTIARGDTLSDIAQRYNTSVTHILSYNKMGSSTIKVGQKIMIPAR
jgi:N-acetylmuramoyl-L-alanine amidase|tara:strand:- start:6790 stop:8118 length:1329 start_codon:yes stop_codon:yes gene_type:complete